MNSSLITSGPCPTGYVSTGGLRRPSCNKYQNLMSNLLFKIRDFPTLLKLGPGARLNLGKKFEPSKLGA